MCGIAGIVRSSGASVEIVRSMIEALVHRGPDDDGVYLSGSVGLGFRRLSILDLSPTGRQPMTTADGAVTIVFNGEIYNYIELRHELETRGHKFQSSGDTEVLLHAYCEWGAECLPRLNGMWAFLIYDQRRKVIFGSRDRFGIKPLYRYQDSGAMLFASEIKAIRASGLYAGSTNWQTSAHFLLQGVLDETLETFYEGIVQVRPGTAFEVDLQGNYRQWPFWSLDSIAHAHIPDPAEAFAELFEDAVRLHMRSDVPMGVNLSGGLDSTSIICAASRIRAAGGASGDLQAFCYMAPEFDERPYIQETIRQSGASLRKLEVSPQELWDEFERVLWFHDEPVHAVPALIGYQLMKLAAAHGVRVILNGQGADETIGGYLDYFRDYWHTLLRAKHPVRAWNEIGAYAAGHRDDRKRLALRQARHFVQTQLGQWSGYRGLRRVYRRWRRDDPWFSPDLSHYLAEERDTQKGRHDLHGVLADAVTRSPLPLYLRIEDRNSMAHSIEVRLPFLDYRLVTLLFNLPPEWKLNGHWNKYVLRRAMHGRIPEQVRLRVDKMGFPVPWRGWAAGDLYEPIREMFDSRQSRERGIYNTAAIIRDLERSRRGESDVSTRMFSIVAFERWARMEASGRRF